MSGGLLRRDTATGRPYDPGDHQFYAASTEPRAIDWFGKKAVRWSPDWVPDTDLSRSRGFHAALVSSITSAGAHDVLTLSFQADAMSEGLFSFLHRPAASGWLQQTFYQQIIQGPSSLEDPSQNATIQEIEDSTFGKEFRVSFGPSLAQISRLGQLNEGWDSYGGGKIEPEARQAAIEFLKLLHKTGMTVSRPMVGPSPTGAVVLQWLLPQIEIVAEIGSDGYEYYVAQPDEDEVRQQGAGDKLEDLARFLLPFLR